MTEPTGTRPRTRAITRGPTRSEHVVRPRCSYEKSRKIRSNDGEASDRLRGDEKTARRQLVVESRAQHAGGSIAQREGVGSSRRLNGEGDRVAAGRAEMPGRSTLHLGK